MEIETFRKISQYELDRLTLREPYCFNNVVSIEKYRVVVEKIPETLTIYKERLQSLWEQSANHHHYESLLDKATELGIVLTGDRGAGRGKNER